ncbi:Detected protein of confused Function [Hibiscus syriacus]|uniref:Detected protein of confused Function n=1 Tax=Hibiscus syriacus TaxID=106335 RepID=A0A6A3CK55_HIBSY|nr:Detected protein of confused Function [Hibiscus syriacus]
MKKVSFVDLVVRSSERSVGGMRLFSHVRCHVLDCETRNVFPELRTGSIGNHYDSWPRLTTSITLGRGARLSSPQSGRAYVSTVLANRLTSSIPAIRITDRKTGFQWRFYPYHYAPFASDLKDLADLEITFSMREPFKPFGQLIGTLPAASSNALPEEYGKLMTDPLSPICNFYPTDFEIDMHGKRFAWQAEEQLRNSVMLGLLYVHPLHPLASQVISYYQINYQLLPHDRFVWPIDTNASGGMNGFLWLSERNGWNYVVSSPVKGLPDIEVKQVVSLPRNITYLSPSDQKHIPKPPQGVALPNKFLTPWDIKPFPVFWHEDKGGRRQPAKDRALIRGAKIRPQLGEAAHRHVKNTRCASGYERGYLDDPNYYYSGQPRAAGPSSYEGGYGNGVNYHGQYSHPQRIMVNPRHPSSNGMQIRNFRTRGRVQNPERYYDLLEGMSTVTFEGRGRGAHVTSSKMPNSG